MIWLFIVLSLILSFIRTEAQPTLAFPGAEGFGRFASGGRGGVVCKVTRLADDNNPGSFRYCMENVETARTIIFTVGGIIDFHNKEMGVNPTIANDLTIACQTAPGDGVIFRGEIKFFTAKNLIVRYCRFHPTESAVESASNGIRLHSSTTVHPTASYSMIFDHIEIGHANDDMGSHTHVGTLDTFLTWQDSIFSEGIALGSDTSRYGKYGETGLSTIRSRGYGISLAM